METGLRDALFRDARALVQKVLNDRTLIPDQAPARPFEVIHRDRTSQVESLFGRIELLRNYYYTKAKTGRFPLDHQLDLVRGHLPGIARMRKCGIRCVWLLPCLAVACLRAFPRRICEVVRIRRTAIRTEFLAG